MAVQNNGCVGITVLVLFIAVFSVGEATKRDCVANVTGASDDPNNIYKCDTTQSCCHEGGVPSCCSPLPTEQAVMAQVQLWSIVAAMILILALLMWYCRHDGDWCCNKKDPAAYDNLEEDPERNLEKPPTSGSLSANWTVSVYTNRKKPAFMKNNDEPAYYDLE